ncbi:MAG: GNAT family N-acetyltransferase [Rhodococcus sp. (in: high G+C Gram-positive bacteria)]
MTRPDGGDPAVGARVVVRYRLPDGSAAPLTDVIGHLEALGDTVTVRHESGEKVNVPRERVVAMKALSPRPIRNSEIRGLESAAADAWPGTDQHWLDGWLLRAGGGVTRRANSAVPLRPEASTGSLPEIESWYRGRGLTPQLVVPDRLLRVPPGWTESAEALVLTSSLSAPVLASRTRVARRGRVRPDSRGAAHSVTESAGPDETWLALHPRYGSPGAAAELIAVRDGTTAYLRVGDVAAARVAVTEAPTGRRWVSITALSTDPEHRRRGHATTLFTEAMRWGSEHGATHAYVQVEDDNLGARQLYDGLGFAEHHRYRYATRPYGSTSS